jgi:type I restriction enzyme S subunit
MRLKYLCSSYSTALTQSEISDDGPFAVYGATGIVGYLSNYSSANEYLSVIKDGAGVGRITYCNPKTSLLGTMAYIIPNEKANINWLKYVLISLDLGKSVSKTTIPHIYFSDYGNREIPYVNRISQQKIADFLDCKCDALDSVLARIRASIEEYKKLKQAVITQAVTKGIRGKRPMKDNGVEWIGVLPTDWSVTALKYCASLQAGITLGKKYPKGTELIEVPYLRVANVQGDHVDISDVVTIQVTAEEIEKYALHDGELLMTEGGDRDKLGRGTVWHGEIVPCIHQNHVFAVETDESKLLVRFFDYVTSAAPARTYFDLTAKKTTNLACTNSTTILSYRFALPPIAEQQEIVEYLDSKCVELDALIAKKEQYLVELENYKKSLIYEYVTGKKEVPEN